MNPPTLLLVLAVSIAGHPEPGHLENTFKRSLGITRSGGCNGGDSCCLAGNCGAGEGDCDRDSDCSGSLTCGHDNCKTGWGGDRSTFDDTDDCCVDPIHSFITGVRELQSENYPGEYPNNLDVLYTIEVTPGNKIEISFDHLDIESHGSCAYDYVMIKEGDGTVLLSKKCGTTKPPLVTSATNKVFVIFHSDYSETKTGFHLTWTELDSTDTTETTDSTDTTASSSCSYPATHTMTVYPGPDDTCVENSIASGLDQASKDLVVRIHNELRNKVALGEETNGAQPSAANMRKLVWDDELATIAQRWTDQCKFGHDQERNTCDGTYVGQNGYSGSSWAELSPYSSLPALEKAVRAWYSEVEDPGFDSASISPFKWDYESGHYTQVVWAETARVGCGLRYYHAGTWIKTLVMCNYARGGNMMGSNMYEIGAPCSKCPAGTTCDSTFPGLCA